MADKKSATLGNIVDAMADPKQKVTYSGKNHVLASKLDHAVNGLVSEVKNFKIEAVKA